MKFKKIILWMFVLSISFLFYTSSYACSSFSIKKNGNVVFGFNFDYYETYGNVMVNQPGIQKTAFLSLEDQPSKWISKYGSITFNGISKEQPFAGMNQKGLVVSMMALQNGGKLPKKDKRTALNELQWIQYQLDNSTSVKDVIATNKDIRISPSYSMKFHYFVCDKSGKSAVIEFLRGKMVIHTGNELPVSLSTNWKYDSSIKQLLDFMVFGDGDRMTNLRKRVDIREEFEGDQRFIKGTYMLKQFKKNPKNQIVSYAFDVLNFIKLNDPRYTMTRWSIVFDPTTMHIYYKTRKNPKIRNLSFKDFVFNANSKDLVYDMEKNINNLKEDFVPYTTGKNSELINSNIEIGTYKRIASNKTFKELIKYPESFKRLNSR